MRDRSRGVAVLAVGGLLIVVAQRLAPVLTPPLYDGVVVVEPYRWLSPPPGQRGDPKSVQGTAGLEKGGSSTIALATPEQPPQAQIFAAPGALILPSGTTSIKLSIAPIPPVVQPTDGHIVGNAYRITVTDQAGTPLRAIASAYATVVLRGPDSTQTLTIERFNGQGWELQVTQDAGFAGTYLSIATDFGDFALVAPGPAASAPTGSSSPGPSPSELGASPSGVVPSATPLGPVGAGTGGGGPPLVLLAALLGLATLGAVGVAGMRRRDQQRQAHRGRRRGRR